MMITKDIVELARECRLKQANNSTEAAEILEEFLGEVFDEGWNAGYDKGYEQAGKDFNSEAELKCDRWGV